MKKASPSPKEPTSGRKHSARGSGKQSAVASAKPPLQMPLGTGLKTRKMQSPIPKGQSPVMSGHAQHSVQQQATASKAAGGPSLAMAKLAR